MFSTPDEVEHAFYDALERGDVAQLMQAWAEDEEVVCIHAGGMRLTGYNAVRESWQQVLAQGARSILPLRPTVMRSVLCVVHVLVEQVSIATPDGSRTLNCFATNVYHKGPRGWRMVMRHVSLAPEDASVLDLHDLPDRLH